MKTTLTSTRLSYKFTARNHTDILRGHLLALVDDDDLHPIWCYEPEYWRGATESGYRIKVSIYDGEWVGWVVVVRSSTGRTTVEWHGRFGDDPVQIGEIGDRRSAPKILGLVRRLVKAIGGAA